MHEWALAEAVLLAARDAALKLGKVSIKRLTLTVGELQGIDIEAFSFSLREVSDLLARESRILVKRVEILVERTGVKCNKCSYIWNPMQSLSEEEREAIHFIPEALTAFTKCPRCGSQDVEIIRGRGVAINDIEFE